MLPAMARRAASTGRGTLEPRTTRVPLHVLVGTTDDDDGLRARVEREGYALWVLPKAAVAGDSALFCIPSRHGPIVARGTIASAPWPHPGWEGRWLGPVQSVEWLSKPLELQTLRRELPRWGWPRSARTYVTVPEEFVDDVRRLSGLGRALPQTLEFDPNNLEDGRDRSLLAVVQRQGQGTFRAQVLRAYEGSCAITNCSVPDVLDAAHILPYRGKQTNHVTNGLLLRTDLHTLFDLGLLAIDPRSFKVWVASSLRDAECGKLHGRKLRLPVQKTDRPNLVALRGRFAERSA